MSELFNKKSARDLRPKVISFRTTLDGLNIAARQSILWPCNAFNISIPQKKKSDLNVFEETVLKMTEIESSDTEKIALLTCLEKELVSFIQNRLNQLGLLNDRYELAEEGKKLLESWRSKDEATVEYVAGTIFVDLHSGKLLPYIYTEKLKQEKILSIDRPFITVELGSTGKSKSERCRQIYPCADSHWTIVPNSNDIIRAIREFKKKYKRYALLHQGFNQYPPLVPIAEAISLHENPELIYLHCNVLIQIGNSDLLVTDGCGLGFSESFANYLTSQNWQWVIDFKNKGVIDKLTSDKSLPDRNTNMPYRYPEVSKRISYSKTSLDKIKNLDVSSTYYEKDYQREAENGIKNIYAGLEWALRQVVANIYVPEWEQVFSSNNFRDNEKLLVGFAQKIGFSVNEKNHSLLQVKPGAIREIDHGKVELQPLLALGIAGANSRANHPVHRLAQNHSGFLSHVLKLKKYRDPIEHGSIEKLNIDKNILEELIETTVSIIVSLVPGVASDLDKIDNSPNHNDINQQRLKATVALEKSLGTAFVSEMSFDMNEQLIRSEMMLAKYTDSKAIEIIKCYASVIHQSLLEATNDRMFEHKSDDIRNKAIDKIIQSGFYQSPDAIPEQISKVNTKRLYRAVRGSSTTLGAHLLAVFLLGSENELNRLRALDPEFVKIVAELTYLRGHGNDIRHLTGFSQDDMESLKNKVFKTIKIITEVF